MNAEGWLADTRTSYDTVATSYADQVRNLLDETPYERAVLALFADLVHSTGGGRLRTWDAGQGGLRPTCVNWAWTRSGSTCRPR
jgi:hypothetical protein